MEGGEGHVGTDRYHVCCASFAFGFIMLEKLCNETGLVFSDASAVEL